MDIFVAICFLFRLFFVLLQMHYVRMDVVQDIAGKERIVS